MTEQATDVERIVLELKLGIAAFETFVRAIEQDEPGSVPMPAANAALHTLGDSAHEAEQAIHRMLNEWAERHNFSPYQDVLTDWR